MLSHSRRWPAPPGRCYRPVGMNELAKIYRDMAARYRADAAMLSLWPDEALALMRQAEECETKAQEHEHPPAAPDDRRTSED